MTNFCLYAQEERDEKFIKSLFRLSDEGGKLEFSLIAEGSLSRSSLDSKDVFIADTGKNLFVWVGKGASEAERKNAMTYAHVSYLCGSDSLIPRFPGVFNACKKRGGAWYLASFQDQGCSRVIRDNEQLSHNTLFSIIPRFSDLMSKIPGSLKTKLCCVIVAYSQ